MSLEWDVNYVAVVVATVVGMVIGAVYFMPGVVGNAWMKAVGKTEEEVRAANQPVLYVLAAIFQLLMAVLLAATIGWADAGTLGGGALVGLLVWIGFAAPAVSLTLLFELRSVASHVIVAGHTLISFVVKGAIIGWWPWGAAPGA